MIRRLCVLSLSLLASLALAAPASAVSFDYPNFSSTAGLAVNGNASQQGSVLQLTPAAFSQVGSAFYTTPIDPQKSFETQFQISMHDTTTPGNPADGMAFVVQSKGPNEAEGLGGGMGYAGIKPSVAVEFDTFVNIGDPPTDHVSIMAEGDATKHLACATEIEPFSPCTSTLGFPIYGAPIYGWVDYDGVTQHLKVFLAQTAAKPAAPLLDHQISLAPLGNTSYVGITAATGASTAVHDVLSWKFAQADAAAAPASPTILPGKAKGKKRKCPKGKKGKAKAKGHGKKAGASKAKKGKGKKCGRGKGRGKKKGHKS